MKSNEQGFVGNALIMAAAVIGTTTIVVQQKQQSVNQQINIAENDRDRENLKIAALNSAARYKSLLADKRIGGGDYAPALMAVDYFADKWTMTDNKSTIPNAKFEVEGNNKVSMKFNASVKEEFSRAKQVLNNGASAGSQMAEEFEVRVINTTKSTTKGIGYTVESIDVEIAKKQPPSQKYTATQKLRVRIPVPEPRIPEDLKILYRQKGVGSFQELTNPNQIKGGEYEFKTSFSGIAVGTKLIITPPSGAPTEFKHGWSDGYAIHHSARRVGMKNVEMPEVTSFSFAAPKPSKISVRFEAPMVCHAEEAEPAVGGGNYNVRMAVIDINGEEHPGKSFDISTGGMPGAEKELTPADYETVCSNECNYVGGAPNPDGSVTGDALGYYWVDIRGGVPIPPMSGYFTWSEANRIGFKTKKYCVQPQGSYDPANPDWFPQAMTFLYTPGFCETPQILGARTACGCVAEDTMITLGDGKTEKRIDQLTAYDTIWNPITKKAMKMKKLTRGPEKIPMLKIEVGGKEISVTGNHPFPARDGMKTAFNLVEGQEIMIGEGQWQKIQKISAVAPDKDNAPVVWNIHLDAPDDDWDAHHYLANGVITGDLLIQIQMENAQRTAAN